MYLYICSCLTKHTTTKRNPAALEALAEAFEARSALLLPPVPTDSDDESEEGQEAKGMGGGGVKTAGAGRGCVVIRLGYICICMFYISHFH